MDRPETIEETGDLVAAAGGEGEALRVDHLEPAQVTGLVARIEAEQGRLDVLVNDIFGGDRYAQWHTKLWKHDLDGGLRMLRMGVHTHLITAALALPLVLRHDGGLVIEVTDGTTDYNKAFRTDVGFYYDLVKANRSERSARRSVHPPSFAEMAHGHVHPGASPGGVRDGVLPLVLARPGQLQTAAAKVGGAALRPSQT